MKILFMGTPEISAVCLDRLIADGFSIVGAVTREDKPKGRGKVMSAPPVKELALRHGIPVFQPKTLRDDLFAAYLANLAPDVIVVVAYGKILPKTVLDAPRYGCINVHVSLLPKYRGAAPMQRAIMAGESETGVTIMYMEEGLDTGDIIAAEAFPIAPTDDFETIHDRSAETGARLLSETLATLSREGSLPRTKQDDRLATYAPKIEKCDAHIDFSRAAKELDHMIRGVTPIPMAYAVHRGALLKICKAVPIDAKGTPGEVIAADGNGDGSFVVACGEGALRVSSVIPEGKGRMSAGDLIRGRKIAVGDILT